MNIQRIGCDVDGVVINFFEFIRPFANSRLGTNVQYDEAIHFDIARNFGVDDKVFKEVHDAFHREVYDHDLTPEIPDSFTVLNGLAEMYEIHFITAAQDFLIDTRTRYLQSKVPGSHVHFTNGHTSILGQYPDRVTKFEKARELGVLAMIDDNPHELEHWEPDIVPYISFAQPWNQSIDTSHPHVHRMGWSEIRDFFLAVRVS